MLLAVKALTDARTDDGAVTASQLQVPLSSATDADATAESAFSALMTEIAVGVLKEGVSSEEYEALLDRVVAAFKDVEGAKGAVWGKASSRSKADGESRAKYVFVVGWESDEVSYSSQARD